MSSKLKSQEEDVDDLDDIVEQFENQPAPTPKLASHATASTSTTASSSSSLPPDATRIPSTEPLKSLRDASPPSDQLPEELAKQLAEGMESLMRELSGGQHGFASEDDRKRQEAWEKMLIEGMDGSGANDITPEETSRKSHDDAFQASILQAMEKLKDSDSTLHTDASSAASTSDDPLEAILNQLGSGLEDSSEDNQELQGMLESMMQQLMSKGVLYEPLKELHEKFPTYLAENDAKLSADDKLRFQNQMTRVTKIVKIFEDSSYKDDQEQGALVVILMNEMQSFGSPPSEIMGPLPPGLDFGADGTPNLPEGCNIS